MNILLTNECNRRCPYCFAGERISFATDGGEGDTRPEAPRFISVENFIKALDFAKKSHLKRISLLGGEPSLHPDFPGLIQQAWDEGFYVTVFSNGMWREEAIGFVEKAGEECQNRLNIVLNINHPSETTERESTAQHQLLSRIGTRCNLSFNIYREDFAPFFLIDIIQKYRCVKNIRLGVAVPLARHDSNHVDVERYAQLTPAILDLAKKCDEHDILLGFDCGFLFCMFTPEQMGYLQFWGAHFKSTCGPAIDIGTDLSVWSCFPLSTFSRGVNLDEFGDIEDLVKHFNKQFERLFRAGAMEKCAGCKYRRREQCIGGCAAHVYRRLNP